MGAIPLVTVLARQQWPAFYIRLGAQVHGRRSPISGSPPQPGMAVALLEDLAATGTSLLRCCKVVQGLGARVVSLYALVDREQGTRARCAAHGLRYRPLITFSELIQPAPETGGT
jgi:orotate phosphoribosyltransferase